jgi:hypothetical protein
LRIDLPSKGGRALADVTPKCLAAPARVVKKRLEKPSGVGNACSIKGQT